MPQVMIVDDEQMMVSLLSTLLEMDGYEVRKSHRLSEAQEAVRDCEPDLIVVDYNLKDGTGLELVGWLRENCSKILPIIVTSGMDREIAAEKAGANRFLLKPFDVDELLDGIKELLIQKKSERKDEKPK